MTYDIETASTAAQKFCDEGLAALAEAKEHRAAAAKDLEAARYEREQAERRHRDIAELEANISRRESKLRALGEVDWLKREADCNAKLEEARELAARFDKEKFAALQVLTAHMKPEAA
jgi:hypothetical protein